ncbi:hypothetical protein [Labilibacter marinus]|uniref:hypothetical protein n=1 Tax=Labilibacter marinus TaxID=1477105 RepID=UPI000830BD13|nr:hypothetical protein [Labilibacter marinus]
MKTSLPLPIFVISIAIISSLCSCSAYQYSTLSSNLPKSQYDDFFYEDDSIQVVYSFDGSGCPIQIDIFNKLDTTIYIDWQNSKLNINNILVPLKPSLSYFNDSFEYGNSTHSTKSKSIERIPAKGQSSIYNTLEQKGFLSTQNADSTMRIPIYTYNTSGTPTKVREHLFNQASSPYKFNCSLAYCDNPNGNRLKKIDTDFWVSSIFRTSSASIKDRKDTFYNSKTTDFGNFMVGVGTVTLLCGYIYLKVLEAQSIE